MKLRTLTAAFLLTGASLALANGGLVDAVKSKDTDAALELISSGADVNRRSVDGTTALHWAAYHGNLALAERLIRAEAEVNVENDYGSSPMQEAAKRGDHDMIKLLLDAGADVESKNPEGQTALMLVARTGNLRAARLLVRKGADVNAVEGWGGQTALMWAAARKQPEMVSFLIDKGANIDQRAIDRDWDRHMTSEPRVKEMHAGGFTPLLYAVRENGLECVRELVEAGADINKPDPENVSPLMLALLNMRFDIAKYLAQQDDLDINAWDYWGRTALFDAADTNIVPASVRNDLNPILEESSGAEVARILLERGANPDLRLKLPPPPRNIVFDRGGDNPYMTTGATPLMRAAYGADTEMMDLLLEYDADINLANVNGITPMLALTSSGGSRNRGKTQEKVTEGMMLLVDAGADINARAARGGETALHTAIRMEWPVVVEFLVENGADLLAEDDRGLIPLHYATGAADSVSFGGFDVVGELPEMIDLVSRLMEQQGIDPEPYLEEGSDSEA